MKYGSMILTAALFALPCAADAEVVTIYEDDFSGSASSNLLGTVTDVGAGTWTSGGAPASFKADGSVVTNSSASGIWLPFTIEPYTVYTLSADVDLTAGNWISLGYAQYGSDNAFYGSGSFGTAIVKPDSVELFPGIGTTGKLNTFSADSGVQQLRIILEASAEKSADWTIEFFVGGVSIGGPVTVASGTFEDISYVGFTTGSGATEGTIENFRFTSQKRRTFELGSCVQQLMWRYGGDLEAQLADLDAAAAAGVDWVRLTMFYNSNLDDNLIAIIQRCNALGIQVLMEMVSREDIFPPGTERRPGNRDEGGWAWDSYRLSDMDLGLAEAYMRDFFTFVQTNGASFQALEMFNEMNWCSFNGDLPIVIGGLTIDESTPWDDPVFEKYREGVLKVARLTKVASDLVDEFFGGAIPIITCGQVSYNAVDEDAVLQGGAGGSMASDVMTLKLMQGAYPQQAESSVLYTDDFNGSSSSNLLATATDTGNAVWTSSGASAAFKADGTVVTHANASGIWLPVSIEAGSIYTLSADVDLTAGNWISLGYAAGDQDQPFWKNGGYGTALVDSTGVKGFPGSGIAGDLGRIVSGGGVFALDIVLDAGDADSANWTMEFFEGGVSVAGPVGVDTGDYGDIAYVGFSTANGTAAGVIDNFSFTGEVVQVFDYLAYTDGIGIHMYPPTFDINPSTAEDTAYAYIAEALDPMLVVPGAGTTRPFWITEFGYTKARCGNNETNRLVQHEVFLDALTRYDRPKSAVGAAMHFVWNDAADDKYSVWDGTNLLKTAEIFLSSAEENTNWTTRLYDAWQVEHFGDQSHLESVSGSNVDVDGDGIVNLAEYAFGGDPTDGQDAGYSPQGSMEPNVAGFNVVYPQRAGGTNSGIRYGIEWSDNLVSNVWNASGVEVLGTNVNGYASGLDAVTIRISTEGKDRQFIRTVVEKL